MRKGTDLLGKVIVSYETGERIARIKDIVFDQDSNQLLALLVEESGWFCDAKIIPFQEIQAIGSDAVIIASADRIIDAKKLPDVQHILKQDNSLKGTHILTTDGRNLGRMIDLYIDEATGTVEGYEVSGGLFADAYSGRSFVPAPQTLKIGKHVAFVPPSVVAQMEEQIGGIRAAMLQAGERVQSAAETTNKTLQAATTEAGYRLQEAGRAASTSLTNAVVDPEEQRNFVVGRLAQDDVYASDGTLVVAKNQPITWADVEHAEKYGILDQLYRAAGGSVMERANQRLQLAAQSTGERIQDAANHANAKLQKLGQDTTSSLKQAIVSPADQKAFAIGRTTQHSVATPNGEVLAIAGQEVTPGIADAAEQHGVLEELYQATGGTFSNALNAHTSGFIARYSIDQALGLRATSMVRTQDGMIIVAAGQIVTDRVIERAKTYHVEHVVLESVGLSPKDAVRSQAHSTATLASTRLSEQLQLSAEHAKVGAVNLWAQLKQAAYDVQQQGQRVWEENRIKTALGRPVTRVILDQNDMVILNVGELVTHQAIESARRAGVLDILLGSIYQETPHLSTAELRAPDTGRAALETRTAEARN